jgi:hypothetical protein
MSHVRSITSGLVLALAATHGTAAPPRPDRRWEVTFEARIVPTEGVAHVTIRLGGFASLVHFLRFRIDPDRHSSFEGDGNVRTDVPYLWWDPPAGGGELRYVFRIDHLRGAADYDARVTDSWALFRGDDLVPPALVDTKDDTRSRSRLIVRVPKGWSVATPYPHNRAGVFEVEHSHRLFDRPTGWIVAADRLGVVRETVAGTKVALAGPVGQGIHRFDMLAMLRWTLPTLRRIAGRLPERLLIVSAGDPMWRGGLSGPGSFFLHADRPLISNDLTSPLLHEVVHVLSGLRAGEDGDWIVEGMSEYYGLQALVRSRTVSERRYERALDKLVARGRGAKTLRVASASGALTARAVATLVKLDERMRQRTNERVSLDDVLAHLAKGRRREITTARFRAIVEKLTGIDFGPFFKRYVP